MRTIYRTIDHNTITGNSITIPIALFSKTENIGLLEDIGTELDMTSGVTVTVTGITDSKLAEVRGFDFNTPYSVGNNGVTQVTPDYVAYIIGNINYITQLATSATTFSFSDTRSVYVSDNFISTDDDIAFMDVIDIEDEVFIERQNISVIEFFSKLRQIGSVEEIATFSNGFYQINNQTI